MDAPLHSPSTPLFGTQPAGPAVEVWIIDLIASEIATRAANALLCPKEQARAKAFSREPLRRRFCLAHAALRQILAQRLGMAPMHISLNTGPQGKPALSGPLAGRLHFNLTHSADLALVAVTDACEVGVDVEKLRPLPDALRLAERFFAPAESAALRTLPETEHASAFLRFWTLKESLAKATGEGVAHMLKRFELAQENGMTLKSVDGSEEAAAQWSLEAFEPAPGYLAAVALPRPGYLILQHAFQPV